jgi:hypothetical protein
MPSSDGAEPINEERGVGFEGPSAKPLRLCEDSARKTRLVLRKSTGMLPAPRSPVLLELKETRELFPPSSLLGLCRVRDAAEASKRAKRRKKRKQEKLKDKAAKGQRAEGEDAHEDAQEEASIAAADELSLLQVRL